MSNANPKADLLADKLREATAAYTLGTPIMSDAEFDALEDALRRISPSHPYFAEVGAPLVDGWQKVKHPIPMGSLDKAQTEEEFFAWLDKMEGEEIVGSDKMDGISLRLTYEGGKLAAGVTRGSDGEWGQDITRNVRVMKGVLSDVLYDGTLHIRGEVVCRKSDHAEHFPDESNPRNTAAGKAVAQTGWRRAQHLTFYAYNIFSENPEHGAKTRSEEFEVLEDWGFNVPNRFTLSGPIDEVKGLALAIREAYINGVRDKIDYDIDGLVFEVNDSAKRETFGSHNLRPKGAVAFKFPHESKPTILRDILWQVGGSGRVTPVAVFDAVELAGASIRQASLHNVAYIGRLVDEAYGDKVALAKGDEILVSRRNDVIPYVEKVLIQDADGETLPTPSTCPSCSTALTMKGEYLICPNEEECPAQALGSLKRWVTKLNILHLGEAILKASVEAGMVKGIGDLYRLEESRVAALTMDGRRVGGAAARGLKNLHAKKAIDLALFVGSLGIPLVGRKMVKILVEAGYDDLSKLAVATEAEMAAVDGFGPGRAAAFRKGYDARVALIQDILDAGVTILAPVAPTGSGMAGEAVCFSGVRDKAVAAAIEAAGGSIASGVSKNTTILVLKDVNSTSSKAKKARDLGIPIMDLAGIKTRVGGF